MKSVIAIFFLFFLFVIGCNDIKEKELREDSYVNQVDSTIFTDSIINVLNRNELRALDSVSKYNLDSVHRKCLSYLYIIYSNETVPIINNKSKITFGETDIQITGFKKIHNRLVVLSYGVFINDSIPIAATLNINSGQIIDGFEIDLNEKKILNAVISDNGRVKFSNVQNLFNNAIKSEVFNDYILKYKTKLHPKFKTIVKQLNLQ